MYSAHSEMPKDKTFKMRLDAQDLARLKAVAEHFSAPAATVIRILIKEKYDAIQATPPASSSALKRSPKTKK